YFERDMAREFEGRMAAVDNVLLEMERRGHDFFDDTMRIGRVMDLLNRSRVQEGFERQVVADAPQQIETRVNDLIDWLVDADFRPRLSAALRAQFQEEIGRSTARMRESIAPYSRFVRAEGDKLQETDARLAQLKTDLERVRQRVGTMAA